MVNLLGILLSVVLFSLTRPPFDIGLLIFGAFVPLFVVLSKTRDYRCMLLFSLAITLLEGSFIMNLGDTKVWVKIVFFVIVISWFLLIHSVFFIIFCKVKDKALFSLVIIPGVWAGMAALSQLVVNMDYFLYLPLYKNTIFLLLGRYLGIHFLTFFIILVNWLLYLTINHKKYGPLAMIIAVILLVTIGGERLKLPLQPIKTVSVCTVQPNKTLAENKAVYDGQASQDSMFYAVFNPELFKGRRLDFIVWPEGVISRWLFRIPDYKRHLLSLARQTGAYLIIGASDLDPGLQEFNSVFLVSPEGSIQRYNKQTLIPLAEGFFKKGKNTGLLKTKYGPVDLKICWEALSLQKQTEANLTFLVTNDLSLGRSSAVITHLRLGVFNAISKGNSLIVCNYTGSSKLITPIGGILKESPPFKPYVLYGKIPVYRNHISDLVPNLFLGIYLLLLGVGLLLIIQRRPIILVKPPEVRTILLTLVIVLLLVQFNQYMMDQLLRKYLPEAELITANDIGSFKTYLPLDERKKCLDSVLSYYGIYLNKYFNEAEINQLDIPELLARIGFGWKEISYQEFQKISLPCIAETLHGWRAIKSAAFTNKAQLEITYLKPNEISRIYAIFPLAQRFDFPN